MSNPLVENIINKLEVFKFNSLIENLEKYTEQLAATPAATPATPAATPATPATPAVPPATPATPATPVATSIIPAGPAAPAVPTTEEVKKTSEEARKFENNMMDSLKWVFIGIALFIVLLIILGFVYWFMFGDANTTHNSEVNDINPNGTAGVDGVGVAAGAAGAAGADAEIPAEIPADASVDNADNANMFSFLSSSFSNREPITEANIEENTMSNSIQQEIPYVSTDVSPPIIAEPAVESSTPSTLPPASQAALESPTPPPAASQAAVESPTPPPASPVESPAASQAVTELPVSIMGESSVPKNTEGIENKVNVDKRGGYTVYTY